MCYKLICTTDYDPVDAEIHTEDIKTIVDLLLQKDEDFRPDINGVLNHPIILAKREEYDV